jgi:hypothetical protein
MSVSCSHDKISRCLRCPPSPRIGMGCQERRNGGRACQLKSATRSERVQLVDPAHAMEWNLDEQCTRAGSRRYAQCLRDAGGPAVSDTPAAQGAGVVPVQRGASGPLDFGSAAWLSTPHAVCRRELTFHRDKWAVPGGICALRGRMPESIPGMWPRWSSRLDATGVREGCERGC